MGTNKLKWKGKQIEMTQKQSKNLAKKHQSKILNGGTKPTEKVPQTPMEMMKRWKEEDDLHLQIDGYAPEDGIRHAAETIFEMFRKQLWCHMCSKTPPQPRRKYETRKPGHMWLKARQENGQDQAYLRWRSDGGKPFCAQSKVSNTAFILNACVQFIRANDVAGARRLDEIVTGRIHDRQTQERPLSTLR